MPVEKLKLLIAEGSEDFRLALADALRGRYRISQCGDGNQARELLRSFHPDVLVLDLMLPGMDGISLLQWAVGQDIHPMVLATTRFANDYVLDAIGRMGVGYVMIKPCDLGGTVARIADLSSRIRTPVVTQPDKRTQVSNLLLALGIPTKLRGYGYLREAILLASEDPSQSITKILYPEVARRCGCAPAHVERSIRSAIAAAWSHRDEQVWRLYFAADETGTIPRPSNGTFVTRLADSVRNQFPPEDGKHV